MTKLCLSAIVAGTIALAVSTFLAVSYKRENDRLVPKASKFDSVCRLVKNALGNDRRMLDDQTARDQMLADFGGNRIGDGAVMLEWCLPRVFPHDAMAACYDRKDYSCIAQILKVAEDSIVLSDDLAPQRIK